MRLKPVRGVHRRLHDTRHLGAFVIAALALMPFTASVASAEPEKIKLRIEGATSTIFEGTIKTEGHEVTTASGGTHKCDGTNLGANPEPGPTPTSAVDSAAAKKGFTWDGTWFEGFEDYFIESIGDSTETSTRFWGVLVNFQFTPVGGCQQIVHPGEEVLWAFNAFEKSHFLKLKKTKHAGPDTVLVTDGSTGEPIEGATVGPVNNTSGVTTNAQGEVTLNFAHPGKYKVKASRSDSLRSNALVLKSS